MNKTLLIEILITTGISIAALGIIFFIINRAFASKGYKTRFFVNLFLGLLLVGLFIISFIVDYKGENIFRYYYRYIILIVVSLTYFLIFILRIYKTIKYSNIRLIKRNIISNGKNYLYVLFKYEEGYLLKSKKSLYQGYIYKMKTSFHDEAMEEVANKFNLGFVKKEFKGKIKNYGKTYYCYLVQADNLISGFEEISMYDLVSIKADDFDKQVILSIILKENFNLDI